ncbi:MAG: hypothetical protein ACLFS2_01360 [Halochromatium sp.]|uniref:hypothetical protein n=1 Tax=Halochromatium sp. TaxID=2049430 RepID=UPI00397D06DD
MKTQRIHSMAVSPDMPTIALVLDQPSLGFKPLALTSTRRAFDRDVRLGAAPLVCAKGMGERHERGARIIGGVARLGRCIAGPNCFGLARRRVNASCRESQVGIRI